MNAPKILIVDDEPDILATLAEVLDDQGYEVLLAGNGKDAHEKFSTDIALVILDVKLGSESGLTLLCEFKKLKPGVPVIMISGQGTVSLTAEAFRLGAHDFMEKPLRLIPVKTCVRNAIESLNLKSQIAKQTKATTPQPIYNSASMVRLYAQVNKLASLNEPVVILGPSGSGKELVARSLHTESSRSTGPFIATNAASMPVTLAEDELFGHEKGAFTGATNRRIGCIESATGGTLFLDEIGDLDLQIQAKLLRVLEHGVITRIGGSQPIRVSTRIVSATHKNLEELSKTGAFRHDLWFRLSAFVVRVPALSDHPEDIALLAQSFCKNACTEMQLHKTISPQAIDLLAQLPWPGNIRELKHTITRAVVYAEGDSISASDISEALSKDMHSVQQAPLNQMDLFKLDFRTARETFEKEYLLAALSTHSNNITATAGAIGMAQSNLSRKLKELGLRTSLE